MGLNIAITSKYNPFTYEDYIKPTEQYWEDYDKYEEDLDKLTTDVATMKSVIGTMKEGAEKDKYNKYLTSLDDQVNSLASEGLTAQNRKALRDLKNEYSELMPRLALAEEARRKDLAEYTKLANSGEYFLYNESPIDKTVEDYLDGKQPSYNIGLSKTKIGQTAQEAGKAYSSRVFPDATTEEITLAGKKFLQVTEERGVKAALEDVSTQDPRFSAILTELYREAGIDNMSSQEQEKAKKHIAKNFWEGLAYQKAVDYKSIASPQPPKDPTPVVAHLPNGNRIVRSGSRHVIVDKDNNFIGEWKSEDEDPKPLTPSQREAAYDRNVYLKTVEGFDNWNQKNIYNKDKVGEHNEKFTNDPKKLVEKYILSVTSPDTTPARHRSKLLTEDLPILYDKALTNAQNQSLFKKYRQIENTMFIGSGSAIGRRSGDELGELLGDNHISLINVDTFFGDLPVDSERLFPVLEDIHREYSNIPNHEAPKKVLEKLGAYIDSLVTTDSSNKNPDQKVNDALEILRGKNEYLYNLLVPNGNSTSQASGKVILPD